MSNIAGYNRQQVSVVLAAGSATPGTTTVPILKAPFGGVTITDAILMPNTAIGANGSNYVTATLIDAGLAGTATTAIGTVGGTAGITAAPNAFSLNTALDELDSGDYLMAKIIKTGTIAENEYSLIVRYEHGKA